MTISKIILDYYCRDCHSWCLSVQLLFLKFLTTSDTDWEHFKWFMVEQRKNYWNGIWTNDLRIDVPVRHYCKCNNVRRTVLHMQSCPPGRCCIMQLCLRHFLQAKCMSWMTREMFGRWVFAAIIKYVNIHACCIHVGSVHARSLTRAHSLQCVQSCTCPPPDGFCKAPDTIAYAKVSGADSIAWRTKLHLTPALQHLNFNRVVTFD